MRAMVLAGAAAVQLLSFSLRSPSLFTLALIVLRRSTLDCAWHGNTLRLLDATDLLSPWLSRSTCDSCCFSLRALRGGSFKPPDLPLEGSPSSIRGGFINLLSTKICAILASCACKHLMVISRLSSPSGSNRLGLYLEVA